MSRYPQDCEPRKIGSKARQIVISSFNMEHWEFHEKTGNDYGIDIELELSEDNEWKNNRIEGQIKGTTSLKVSSNKQYISFSLNCYTIKYALNSPYSFVLFLVDVLNSVVYYLPIQEYFIVNNDLTDKLDSQSTINVHVPTTNIVNNQNDFDLQQIAKSRYI